MKRGDIETLDGVQIWVRRAVVEKIVVPASNERPERTFFRQRAGWVNGYGEENQVALPCEAEDKPYEPGIYEVPCDVFEFNRERVQFRFDWKPVRVGDLPKAVADKGIVKVA